MNKPESCINETSDKVPMQEIFVNVTCIKRNPVYYEDESLSQEGLF
jgi:hypothetical protein